MTDETDGPAPIDDAVQVFEELRSEVSFVRAAVEGLAAVRERLPDYSVTLGEMAQSLKRAAEDIERIERSPAVRLSPAALTAEIDKASVAVRAEDHALLRETRDAFVRSIGRIDAIVVRGQAADRQTRRLIWVGAIGAVAGMLLMSVLPGAIARSLPASWRVPEWMAARTMGLDQQSAGERLIATERTSEAAEGE